MCYTMRMVLRCTKAAAEYGNITLSQNAKAENRYCDWFVDMFNDANGRNYFLVTNAFSLFSVVFPAEEIVSQEKFLARVNQELQDYCNHKNVTAVFTEHIAPHFQHVVFSKTNSRSVQGSMRGMKERLPVRIRFLGGIDKQEIRFSVDDHINKMPYNCAATEAGDCIFPERFIPSDTRKKPVPDEPLRLEKKLHTLYQFYAELKGSTPKIWRRFLISPSASMEDMAFVLMILFNADNSHLYRFEIPVRKLMEVSLKNQRLTAEQMEERLKDVRNLELESYVDEQMDFMDDMFMPNNLKQLPPKRCEAYHMKIKNCISTEIPECTFFYDFGDGWEFKLKLENAEVQSPLRKPQALSGEGLGIIEDCGGIGGLSDIRRAFAKKSGEDYENYKAWLGKSDIDLDCFDAEKVNRILKKEL